MHDHAQTFHKPSSMKQTLHQKVGLVCVKSAVVKAVKVDHIFTTKLVDIYINMACVSIHKGHNRPFNNMHREVVCNPSIKEPC